MTSVQPKQRQSLILLKLFLDRNYSMTDIIHPGSTIGILGGGQLGRMLAMAASKLGYKTHIYCPEEDSPAFQIASSHTVAEYLDEGALKEFASQVDVVTYEFENVPARTAHILAQAKMLRPVWKALAVSQDRLSEKDFLNEHGIETAPYQAFQGEEELRAALSVVGKPAVAKTRRFGYDGKGQAVIRSSADIPSAMKIIGEQEAILEGFIAFDREISAIVTRSESGDVAAFPVSENVHTNHILDETTIPAVVTPTVSAKAQVMATKVANALEYIGVVTIEMFVSDQSGKVLVNEIAPRVHNSGHWTIEGAKTSQFEQHIRAICGLPLGDPAAIGSVRMKNLLGEDILKMPELLADSGAHVHHYGKVEPRMGRKMGHVTWVHLEAED